MHDRRSLWILRGWLLAVTGLITFLIVNSRQQTNDNKVKIDAICRSFASAGNLDVPVNPTMNGIAFIAIHRNGAIVLGCGNLLKPASDELKEKAKHFGIDLRG
jgi:hypothetical protein